MHITDYTLSDCNTALQRRNNDCSLPLCIIIRNIKMSSPYLNNMIIIGCLLTYTSVILMGLDSHLTSEAALPVICTARIWTLMAGFTLAFGSMFSKTWRVHSIFTDVKLNKKVILQNIVLRIYVDGNSCRYYYIL